jgi:feruloyl-CoA synthase
MMVVPYRENAYAPREAVLDELPSGALVLRSPLEAREEEPTICNYLPRWAGNAGDRIFLGEKAKEGGWRTITYSAAWDAISHIGAGLINLGAKPGARVALLSGNSIDHALLTLATMSIGAIAVPISPNYSLLDGGLARLTEIAEIVRPDFCFAHSWNAFKRALDVPLIRSAKLLSTEHDVDSLTLSDLADKVKTTEPFFKFFEALESGATAKILFTSGSTGSPKGVINTHRMLASVVAMVTQLTPAGPQPPVQLEWLPWHHTMGGNAALNGIIRSGGTLYIDDGRPTPQLFAKTIANLKEISPTTMFSVPAGFAMLAEALEQDEELCRAFFSRLNRMTYGGAAIPASVLERLQAKAVQTIGLRIPIMCGYGLTETAPTVSVTHWPSEISGEIGLPLPGLELKLQPAGDEYELRVRGPTVTPGYFGLEHLNKEIFDEDGFYRTGDIVDFIDRSDPSRGLRFVGRLAENFKLATGTWVNVGELRLTLLNVTGGALQDVVVVGENDEALSILAWPNADGCKSFLENPGASRSMQAIVEDNGLKRHIANCLARHNTHATSSMRISAFMLSAELPSLAAGEITDKAYVNQRAVLRNRAEAIAALKARSAVNNVVSVA